MEVSEILQFFQIDARLIPTTLFQEVEKERPGRDVLGFHEI